MAGTGMVFGLCISYYYLDYRYHGWLGLLAAIAVAIAAGLWLDLHGRKRLSGFEALVCELAIAVAAAAVIVFPPLLAGRATSVGTMMLLGMGLVVPAAITVLGRLPRRRPALPPAIAMSQVVFLALLAHFATGRHPGLAAWYDAVPRVAAPVAGATAAALIYVCRMPWRTHEAIATGTPTRVGLGLVVAWAAVHLGIGPESGAAGFPTLVWAIVWVLVVPVCELARLACLALWRLVGSDRGSPAGPGAAPAAASAAVLAAALAAGAIGVSLYGLRFSPEWVAVLLAPAVIGYLVVPLLIQSRRDAQPAQALDTHG